MSTILPAGPGAKRYAVTATFQVTALDSLRLDARLRRTKLGMPLARVLTKAGFVVEDWRPVLAATSVTARVAEDGLMTVTAVVPRPHQVPDGELNPERSITVEYVGGADDGWVDPLEFDPVVPPSLPISLNGSVYTRYAYDLATGTWLYQRIGATPPPADDEEEEELGRAPNIEDDPLDWP